MSSDFTLEVGEIKHSVEQRKRLVSQAAPAQGSGACVCSKSSLRHRVFKKLQVFQSNVDFLMVAGVQLHVEKLKKKDPPQSNRCKAAIGFFFFFNIILFF